MIIHSSFRDYYDIGLRYGVDTTLHWNRETSEVAVKTLSEPFKHMYLPRRYDFDGALFKTMLVVIAGKPYDISHTDSRGICNISLVDGSQDSSSIWKTYSDRTYTRRLSSEAFYGLHVGCNSPVLMFCHREVHPYGNLLVVNPCLRDIGFQSILDPYTCFQEISMYLSGVMGCTEKDVIEVSDVTQKYKKGFDDNSFKHRGSKKPRRKGGIV